MSSIDNILLLLKDGEWHDLNQIAEKLPISPAKAELAVSFLAEYNFVKLTENTTKVKLQSPLFRFINELQRLEQETALST